MRKHIITGAFVLFVLGFSTNSGYATYLPIHSYMNNSYVCSVDAKEIPQSLSKEESNSIEIISPKEDIIIQDRILISVKVKSDASVSLSVYKEDEEDECIFGPEEIQQGENLKFYRKELKDLTPGQYRIQFDIDDEENQQSVTKTFEIKDKEEQMNDTLNTIQQSKVTDIIKDIQSREDH